MHRALIGLLLVTATLLAGCSSSPQGGLPQEVQENGWTVEVTYPNGTTHSYHTTSDPDKTDTSGNGLNDFQEYQLGTDPRKLDTDDDGLLDGPNQCVDEGSQRHQAFQDADIVEHPDDAGCFLGEQPLTFRDLDVSIDPTDAYTSDNQDIGNGLTDSEEILGWTVQLEGGEDYWSYSNPRVPDTSGNGLHDGLEKALGTDPQLEDTDGDGVNDQLDAAPLGNLLVTFTLDEVFLKEDKTVLPGGGAELVVELIIEGDRHELGPYSLDPGENNLDVEHEIDVPDRTSGLEDGSGAGNWEREVHIAFWHNQTDGEEVHVRQGSGNTHILQLTFAAFEDTWTGHAQNGTSSGQDADVTLDLESSVEPAS